MNFIFKGEKITSPNVSDFINLLDDNYFICVGNHASYAFMGTAGEFKRQITEIDEYYHEKNAEFTAEQNYQNANQIDDEDWDDDWDDDWDNQDEMDDWDNPDDPNEPNDLDDLDDLDDVDGYLDDIDPWDDDPDDDLEDAIDYYPNDFSPWNHNHKQSEQSDQPQTQSKTATNPETATNPDEGNDHNSNNPRIDSEDTDGLYPDYPEDDDYVSLKDREVIGITTRYCDGCPNMLVIYIDGDDDFDFHEGSSAWFSE